jgi:hypothetical protein
MTGGCIVSAENVAGKLSFVHENLPATIFALRRRREKFNLCTVCPMV